MACVGTFHSPKKSLAAARRVTGDRLPGTAIGPAACRVPNPVGVKLPGVVWIFAQLWRVPRVNDRTRCEVDR